MSSRMTYRRLMSVAVCFLLTLVAGSISCGQSKTLAPQADQLFESAHTAWKIGQWMEATSLYKQAASTATEEEELGLDAQLHYAEALSFLTAPELAIAEY